MITFAPLLVFLVISVFAWLLFTLAVFALPVFAGVTVNLWAFHTRAGALGGIAVALVAAAATFSIGQLALALVTWTWLRLLVITFYVAPATVAGYSAKPAQQDDCLLVREARHAIVFPDTEAPLKRRRPPTARLIQHSPKLSLRELL
ncbi:MULTISPECIES: hypothetical protein [Bradyrhizobium]|uniref:hypothetical protein n=1 Tax=Bradyrhizobium TaxID=374 RepID=UPI001E5B166C|nr:MULTISPECIES: hypothetical protein [Bradyrhizobium]UFW51440.1 hypothetical protein BaraCB756_10870 [Bradyrhizobium arachidis]